jgi:hypothetical protein
MISGTWDIHSTGKKTSISMASMVVCVSISDNISLPEIAYPDSDRAISVASEADCMLAHDGTGKVCPLDQNLSAIKVHCRIIEGRLDIEVATEIVVHVVLESGLPYSTIYAAISLCSRQVVCALYALLWRPRYRPG